jgi:hypothetical protein
MHTYIPQAAAAAADHQVFTNASRTKVAHELEQEAAHSAALEEALRYASISVGLFCRIVGLFCHMNRSLFSAALGEALRYANVNRALLPYE